MTDHDLSLPVIYNMPAGDEINSLVAEKVMGWHRARFEWKPLDSINLEHIPDPNGDRWADGDGHYMVATAGGYEDDEDINLLNWHPSESMLWAMAVVHKLEENDWDFYLNNVIPGSDTIVYEVKFQKAGEMAYACDVSPELAICHAALVAVGIF